MEINTIMREQIFQIIKNQIKQNNNMQNIIFEKLNQIRLLFIKI